MRSEGILLRLGDDWSTMAAANPTTKLSPTGAFMEGRNPRIMLLAEATGGVMRHAIDLYKGLRARGWRVGIVLSPSRLEARYRGELDRLDQNDITYVPMQRAPHVADLRAYSEIAKLLSDGPGDTILHAHSTKAGMIGSLFHSRVRASVFTPHAYRGVDPTSSRFSKTLLKAGRTHFQQRLRSDSHCLSGRDGVCQAPGN